MSEIVQQRKNTPTKRVMVFDFHSTMMIEVVKNLKERGMEPVYWSAGKRDFMNTVYGNKKMFPNAIFHNADDAVAAIPAPGIDVSSFEPIGKELVDTFLECELRTLIMMEELDRSEVPLMKKVHIYHEYLKYWHGVLKKIQPDAIIYQDVPHMSHKYVVYCLAKHLGIPQVMIRNTNIGGRLFLANDIEKWSALERQIAKNSDKNFTLNDLSQDVRDYYEKQQRVDKSPFYVRPENIKTRTWGLFRFLPSLDSVKRNIKNFTFLKHAILYIKMLFIKRDIPSIERMKTPTWAIKLQERKWQKIKNEFKKEYTKYQTAPGYSKKYIYVPLQRQQEKSTSTDGDVFADQILMVDILSHAVPLDWIIYVKESPLQWSMPRSHVGRFKGYTEELIKKGNVRVVPADTSTFDLIRNSQAVAAVTGTAAWEAALRGKPSLVFGHTWYPYCDGIFKVRDIFSAKDALKKIMDGYTPDQQNIINVLKAFDGVTICGYRDGRFKHGDDLNVKLIKTDEENIKSLTEGITEALLGLLSEKRKTKNAK